MTIEISKEDSEYMYNIIQKIIDEAGCRMPCSPNEAKAAEIIEKELSQTCDETAIEPFSCHPRAFLGWIRIDMFLILFSILSFFGAIFNILGELSYIFVIVSFILNILAFIIIWEEFFNYREFVDKLFKERDSENVVGKIKAKGETKKIIIFSGHHDSALQFNLLRYLKIGYAIVLFLALGIFFFWIFISLIIFSLTIGGIFLGYSVIYAWFYDLTMWIFIIGIVPIIVLFFFVSSGEKANKVPGAIDNLSAVAVVLAVGRYLKKHKDIIPNNTEIRLVSFGCEEAGLRGAYRYAKAYSDELKKFDANVINMDGIQSVKNRFIIAFEPTTRTKHSEEVVQRLIEGSKLVGAEAKIFGSSGLEKFIGQISGGTDAAALSKAGVKASTIMTMELKKFIKFYHQPTDRVNMIDKGALEIALKICLGYLLNAPKSELKK